MIYVLGMYFLLLSSIPLHFYHSLSILMLTDHICSNTGYFKIEPGQFVAVSQTSACHLLSFSCLVGLANQAFVLQKRVGFQTLVTRTTTES